MASCCGCCPDDTMRGDIQTDEFCGNFVIPCQSSTGSPQSVLLWQAVNVFDGAQTGGTVSIYYENGCSDAIQMIPVVIQNGVETDLPPILIAPGNTRSYTTINIVGLRVLCTSANPQGNCRGKYCVNYHYDVLAV